MHAVSKTQKKIIKRLDQISRYSVIFYFFIFMKNDEQSIHIKYLNERKHNKCKKIKIFLYIAVKRSIIILYWGEGVISIIEKEQL